MTSTKLQDYADKIQEAAKALDTFQHANNDTSDGRELPVNAPHAVIEAREALIDAATRLLQDVSEPTQFLPNLAVQGQQISGLRWLCRFNVISLVPLDGSISYADLAAAAKVPLKQLKSIVRMLMCANFFAETASQNVQHTKLSAQFARSEPLQTWAIFLAEDSIIMGLKMYEATSKWGATTSKTETSFNLALGTDEPFFEWLSTTPEATKKFSSYMKAVTATYGTSLEHLVDGYDWASRLRDGATVVDVGGSLGHASIALARKHKGLKFIVQDLPRVIQNVDATSIDEDAGVRDRITFAEHDFFEPQPVEEADVYLLRQILHDWPDADATKILQNISTVMRPDARIMIMDSALPLPGTIGRVHEAQLRVRDMTMMQAFNASERELEDWKKLLKDADERLEMESVEIPTGSNLAILVARLK
ncbi:hydroxyindole O-methyltransferase, putative [Cordyceps militaris CM01]|uniref:Hydroxyindole O-methyltransferase, putative n=1 Tax=Cordyceps militaris (strain CM01) TaxID=983644 RepID=G3J2Y4_CORMM|nr:hydroxyindole O-methyltransferase, putative [Cordyceps militaris CM01]EGX97263.1 hydroxyindole O-methyltransferase, putative [Cordyceps militaris CM01]